MTETKKLKVADAANVEAMKNAPTKEELEAQEQKQLAEQRKEIGKGYQDIYNTALSVHNKTVLIFQCYLHSGNIEPSDRYDVLPRVMEELLITQSIIADIYLDVTQYGIAPTRGTVVTKVENYVYNLSNTRDLKQVGLLIKNCVDSILKLQQTKNKYLGTLTLAPSILERLNIAHTLLYTELNRKEYIKH